MLDYLIDHARRNVWCSPEQDDQAIIKLARLSHVLGVFNTQQVLWEDIRLPTQRERYHVYQLGRVHPKLLGLMNLKNDWTTLTTLINSTSLMGELYTAGGRIIPRIDCYFRFTHDNNVIVAIKHRDVIKDLYNTSPYLRVYTNAYYKSDRSGEITDNTYTTGRLVNLTDDIMAMQALFRSYRDRVEGHAVAYVNGYYVDDFIPNLVKLGDVIEFVWDRSVHRVVEFWLKDQAVFDSVLDSKRKYLLHPPKQSQPRIDFEDDIDLYLYRIDNGRERGVYYHRNRPDSIRMLTHQDYSLPVDYLNGYQALYPEFWDDVNGIRVRLLIRNAGYDRPLVYESHRILELYRLNDTDLYRAMAGMDSTVEEWRAPALENSAYTKLMRHKTNALSLMEVQEAYGYNAMSRLVGNTPQAVIPESLNEVLPRVELLPGQQRDVTVYEYDGDGLLLDWYVHLNGLQYTCRSQATRMVEIIPGIGGNRLDAVFGQTSVSTNPIYNYRVYLCSLLGDTPYWDWVDVSNSDILTVGNNTIGLAINEVANYPAIISDARFIAETYMLAAKNGVFKLSVSNMETHFDVTERRVKTIPPRKVDVWLNRHSLIEGLDYHVRWPEIVIVNKQYIDNTETDTLQRIDIRATGFCNADLSTDVPREAGFVKHGFLSADNRYNVRDDKVVTTIVGGKLMPPFELAFAEDNLGVAVPGVPNGTPYSLREIVIPIRAVTYMDTYSLREAALETDKRVEDYLTVKYPQPVIDGPILIQSQYAVHSPFLARLIDDMQTSVFNNQQIEGHYSNADVYAWVEEYRYLLDFDPAHLGVDTKFVKVHPHRFTTPVDLSVYQFNFLKRVVDLHFDGKVDLSQFIHITLPGASNG